MPRSKICRLLVLLPALLTPIALAAPTPIESRQLLFQDFKHDIAAIKRIVNANTTAHQADLLRHARALAFTSARLWEHLAEHFPTGSDQGDTKAGAQIWRDPVGFLKAIDRERSATAALLIAAQSVDVVAWRRSYGKVTDACKHCHQHYKR